jgi:hypothetical protein
MDNYNNFGGERTAYNVQLAEARELEKKALFKNASILGALLLLYLVFNRLFLNLFYIGCYVYFKGAISLDMITVKSYLVSDHTAFVRSSAFSMTVNLFVTAMSVLCLAAVAAALKVGAASMLKPYKGFMRHAVYWFPMCVTLNIIVTNIVSAAVSLLGRSGVTVPDADFTISSPSAYSIIIQLIYVCLIGPIIEEFIYRGLVIRLLSPFGKGLAVVFSALIFGIMHGNIPQAASAFAGGLVYAMIAVRFNSIAPTIVIHMLNNICASVVDVGDVLGWDSAYEFYLATQIVILFIGMYLVFTQFRRLAAEIRAEEPRCALRKKQRYISTATNIFMLVYFLYQIYGYILDFIVSN